MFGLTFDSVDDQEILKCDHSNESYKIYCSTVHCAIQVDLTLESVDEIPICNHSNGSH